jgi:hypothetical protein
MAHYLRTRQLDRVVANLHYLDDLGYPDVPRHLQEAALLYVARNPEKAADLQGLKISPEARDDMRRFLQVSVRYSQDGDALRNVLMASHDRSYFLYFATGFSDSRWATLVGRPSTVSGATK